MLKKETKKTCTYRMRSSTIYMLDDLHEATGISRSEIIAQLVHDYYNNNNNLDRLNTTENMPKRPLHFKIETK